MNVACSLDWNLSSRLEAAEFVGAVVVVELVDVVLAAVVEVVAAAAVVVVVAAAVVVVVVDPVLALLQPARTAAKITKAPAVEARLELKRVTFLVISVPSLRLPATIGDGLPPLRLLVTALCQKASLSNRCLRARRRQSSQTTKYFAIG
jgi:hypothetical protein